MSDALFRAAAAIREATESILFLTSAGMSADSGIPTFRDRDGYWRNFPPFKELGLVAEELASPFSFRIRPERSWAFYEWRRRNAHMNRPHAGYAILNALMQRCRRSFVQTTNTDGYHLRSGVEPSSVREVHGSMWRLQCMRGSRCRYGYRDSFDVPLCDLDETTMIATNLPKCPECGELLRPHILMWGDSDYLGHPIQDDNFTRFLTEVTTPQVVVLVGSSAAVPTNDYLAARLQRQGSIVITINPDCAALEVCRPDLYLPRKAAHAFEELAQAIL